MGDNLALTRARPGCGPRRVSALFGDEEQRIQDVALGNRQLGPRRREQRRDPLVLSIRQGHLVRQGRAPFCHSVTSPPAQRGERKSGRDDFFSSLLVAERWVLGAAEGVGLGGAGEGVGDDLGGGGEVGVDDGELEVGGAFAAEGEGEGGVVADGGDDQVVGVGCGEGEAEAVAGADGAADGVELESSGPLGGRGRRA